MENLIKELKEHAEVLAKNITLLELNPFDTAAVTELDDIHQAIIDISNELDNLILEMKEEAILNEMQALCRTSERGAEVAV